MDKEPLNSERTREDGFFADYVASWSHIVNQVNDGLHEGEDVVDDDDVQRVLELLGITLRSCDGRELIGIFSHLGIDLQTLLTDESESIRSLMAHDHQNWSVTTEPITDDLPTWSAKCTKCGEGRRIVRV